MIELTSLDVQAACQRQLPAWSGSLSLSGCDAAVHVGVCVGVGVGARMGLTVIDQSAYTGANYRM